ncbi:MAG: hypothetical protein L3K15_08095 [Thermoplasmata archaeon]|nr:hypothetical protein [Thermoplasmata archaeon]
MRPVPDWIVQVALPHPGEQHVEFWGPVSARTEGQLGAGYIVLTSQRFVFLRSAGRAHSDLAEGFDLPLAELRRVTASAHGVEVHLRVNHHEFRIIAPGDVNSTDLAHEMRTVIVETRRQRVTELKGPPPSTTGGRSSSHAPGETSCRYCGTILPASALRCPSCGAPRRR